MTDIRPVLEVIDVDQTCPLVGNRLPQLEPEQVGGVFVPWQPSTGR